jgi:hypothetical protein
MDAKTARTLNIRSLVAATGGPKSFSERYFRENGSRWEPAQVSQWISLSKPKGVGHALAREIERVVGWPVGWMDQIRATDYDPATDLHTSPPPAPALSAPEGGDSGPALSSPRWITSSDSHARLWRALESADALSPAMADSLAGMIEAAVATRREPLTDDIARGFARKARRVDPPSSK